MSARRTAQERMSAPPDERELVERSRRGDLESFNCLVVAYQNRVYSLCLRMLGSPESADDATQETFIAAYRSVGKLSGALRPWLLRIASNACIDELRHRKRHPSVSLDAPATDAERERPLDPPDDPSKRPESVALQYELSRALQAELLRLPPEQRLAVILCDVEGLSYDEIAESMESSVGTVKSRISRGRSRLREQLRGRPELFGDKVRHTE